MEKIGNFNKIIDTNKSGKNHTISIKYGNLEISARTIHF